MSTGDLPAFHAAYAPADEPLAARLLAQAARPADAEARIDARARRYVEAIRAGSGGLGGVEEFLHEYSLSTKEGLALMVLAEALLRVPDDATADLLIEDKLSAGDFVASRGAVRGVAGIRLGLGARPVGADRRARTKARKRSSAASSSGSACRRCGRRPGRRCGSWLAFRARADHRGGAGACRRDHGEFLLFLSTCWARAPAPPPTPSATSRPMRRRSKRSGARPATGAARGRPGHFGQALGAASALRGGGARAGARRTAAERLLDLARRAKAHDLQFHRRRRGGGPARAVARGDRARCSPIPRSPAGADLGSRCRPIRSARAR